MLNLNEFFHEIENEVYCIIKLDEKFPNYSKGSDVDIFCYDSDVLVSKILSVGNKYVNANLEIYLSSHKSQVYVDFIHKVDGSIEFRFDIYTSLPEYKNILLKPSFFENILENRTVYHCSIGQKVFIPDRIDDFILRYIEYQEWYGRRPDKIKHMDYILNLCDDLEKETFLQKLHHYTEIPRSESRYPIKKKKYYRLKNILKIIFYRLPKKIQVLVKQFI